MVTSCSPCRLTSACSKPSIAAEVLSDSCAVPADAAGLHVHRQAIDPLSVGTIGETAVGLRRIEFWKVETRLTVAGRRGAGDEQLQTPAGRLASGHAQPPRVEGAEGCLCLEPTRTLAALGDDADDGRERARPVQRCSRSANDLDALHVFQLHREFVAEKRGVEHVVVQAVSIDQDEDPRVQITRSREPAKSQIAVRAWSWASSSGLRDVRS